MIINPVNFRDLGGIPVEGGNTVKAKRILRSGELYGLTDAEKTMLTDEYHLKTIVDLRSGPELTEHPDDTIAGVKYVNLDVMKDAHTRNSSLKSLSEARSADEMHMMMRAVYEVLVRDKTAQEGYRKYIEEYLMLEEGALIFHCFAGKDRTGVAAAIILTLLGADEESIFTDYLATNQQRAQKNAEMLEQIQKAGASEGEIAAMQVGLNVDESYLRSAYNAAKADNGSFLAHIKKTLHVTDEEINRLRSLYTA